MNNNIILQKKDDFDPEELGESGIDHEFVRITYDIVLSLVIIICCYVILNVTIYFKLFIETVTFRSNDVHMCQAKIILSNFYPLVIHCIYANTVFEYFNDERHVVCSPFLL